MKSPSQSSLSRGRHALCAAFVAILFAASAAAQSSASSAGASTYGSSTKSPSSSSATADNPDVQSTKEINKQTSIGAGAMTGRETTSGRDKLSWMDRRFVNKAADEGKAEVQLAELAAQRASNPEVKSFAQKLVDDHTQVNTELTSIAGQKNVKLDNDDDHDRAYKRLSKKSGAEFDQEFVEHMIDEHEKDIKMFEKAAKDAKDPDIRSFASKHVDHLRSHLEQAQGLRQSVMPTGRMDTNSGRSTPGGTTSPDASSSSTSSGTDTNKPDSTSSSTTPKPDSSR